MNKDRPYALQSQCFLYFGHIVDRLSAEGTTKMSKEDEEYRGRVGELEQRSP